MRDLRVALVAIPPLLADLVRYALMSRVPVTGVCELADVEGLERLVGSIDVVLLGSPGLVKTVNAEMTAKILVLSDDLQELSRPATGRSIPLNIENLIGTLERMGEGLDRQSRSNLDP